MFLSIIYFEAHCDGPSDQSILDVSTYSLYKSGIMMFHQFISIKYE